MRKTERKLTALLLALLLTTVLFSGCSETGGSGTETADKTEGEKEVVSVALWGGQLLEDYAPWLQEQYPDVEFDFYVATNSAEYYNYCAENDILPDIMTVRRFSLHDMEAIKDRLLDLSDMELAYTFYQSYLDSYTYSDGTINWLPACAEIDDIAVNKTLFEEYDIPLPTDYESFLSACQAFEELGIQGYAADFSKDYTCMMVLQGFASAELTSAEGRQWRQQYESDETDQLSEEIWLPAFEKLSELIQSGAITDELLETSENELMNAFSEGKIAMVRATGTSFVDYDSDYEVALLPYFGDDEDDSWYLTYPAFQIAANADCAEDPEREALIVDIMTTMLSEEGLNQISGGTGVVAYNRGVELELSDELSDMESYIKDNKLYIRLASSEIFSISKSVVTKMLTGELTTAEAALAEFNSELSDGITRDTETVMHLDRSYSHTFENGTGNEAASAIYNTVREELGVDCVIGGAAIAGADIPEGDYTATEAAYVTVGWDGGSLLKMELTGAELKSVVQYFLDAKGTRDSVTNNSTLPASGGFEMSLTKTDSGYTVDALTIDGEEVSDTETYSVVVRITYAPNIADFEAAGFTDYEKLDTTLHKLLEQRLIDEGGQLAEPTPYITVS